jgi:hypothetical protein
MEAEKRSSFSRVSPAKTGSSTKVMAEVVDKRLPFFPDHVMVLKVEISADVDPQNLDLDGCRAAEFVEARFSRDGMNQPGDRHRLVPR